jgi:hypothetical protein
LGQGQPDQAALLAGSVALDRVAITGRIRNRVQFVGVDLGWAGPSPAIEVGIAGDAEQPGGRRTGAPEREQAGICFDERFLRQFLGVIHRAAELVEVTLHRLVVETVQRLKCLLLP